MCTKALLLKLTSNSSDDNVAYLVRVVHIADTCQATYLPAATSKFPALHTFARATWTLYVIA